MQIQRWLLTKVFLVLLFLDGLGMGPAQASPILFQVSVDTSTITQPSGYVDFQFNYGGSDALPATATVTNFTPLNSLNPSDLNNFTTGDVSDSLANSLTLSNSIGSNNPSPVNEFFEGFNFGNSTSLGFTVMLSGAALDTPPGSGSGSTFYFSLYGSDTVTPLLPTNPYGSLLTITVNSDGSIQSSSQPGVTVYPLVSSTPEPSSFLLFASLLPAGWVLARRIRPSRTRATELPASRPESL